MRLSRRSWPVRISGESRQTLLNERPSAKSHRNNVFTTRLQVGGFADIDHLPSNVCRLGRQDIMNRFVENNRSGS